MSARSLSTSIGIRGTIAARWWDGGVAWRGLLDLGEAAKGMDDVEAVPVAEHTEHRVGHRLMMTEGCDNGGCDGSHLHH